MTKRGSVRKKAAPKKPPLGSGKRFDALENELLHRKGVRDPGALAASIGRKKYGKTRFQKLGEEGREKGRDNEMGE